VTELSGGRELLAGNIKSPFLRIETLFLEEGPFLEQAERIKHKLAQILST